MDKELEQKIIVVMGFMGWEIKNESGEIYFITPDGMQLVQKEDILETYPIYRDWGLIHSEWEKFRELTRNLSQSNIVDSYEYRENIGNAISYGTKLQAFNALHDGIKWFNELNKEG
jgi:hypothetical protein